MVDVGEMPVLVLGFLVDMTVRMRFCIIGPRRVRVLVVLVVRVFVSVFERFMMVRVLVALGEMQPDAHAHQSARAEEETADGFA